MQDAASNVQQKQGSPQQCDGCCRQRAAKQAHCVQDGSRCCRQHSKLVTQSVGLEELCLSAHLLML